MATNNRRIPGAATGQPAVESPKRVPDRQTGQPSFVLGRQYSMTAYYVNVSAGASLHLVLWFISRDRGSVSHPFDVRRAVLVSKNQGAFRRQVKPDFLTRLEPG